MSKKHFTFFSVVFLGVFFVVIELIFCGCKPKTTAERLEKARCTVVASNNPCVYVCGIPKLGSGNETGEVYSCSPLSDFCVATEFFRNPVGFHLSTGKSPPFTVILNLCKKENDLAEPGNLLMDWEIEYQGTVYPVRNISWNQKDLLLLWACGDGAVYLDRERKSSIR